MNKDYSSVRRCILPSISQCFIILLLVAALVIGWGGFLSNEQPRNKNAVVFIVISAQSEFLTCSYLLNSRRIPENARGRVKFLDLKNIYLI